MNKNTKLVLIVVALALLGLATAFFDDIGDAFEDAFEDVVDWGEDFLDEVQDKFDDAVDFVKDNAKKLIAKITQVDLDLLMKYLKAATKDIDTDDPSDQSGWMINNWGTIADLPIRRFVLPGTHDAGTYDLGTDKSPDAPDQLNQIDKFLGVIDDIDFMDFLPIEKPKEILMGFAVTQSMSVKKQLKAGIRFLDIRVCEDKDDKVVRICHGFFGPKIKEVFQDIADFMKKNTGEVIILHLRSLVKDGDYNWHYKSVDSFISAQQIIAPYANKNQWLGQTYRQIYVTGKRLLIINEDFKNPARTLSGLSVYDYKQALVAAYPNEEDPSEMEKTLRSKVASWTDTGKLNQAQYILTPKKYSFAAGNLHHLSYMVHNWLPAFIDNNSQIKDQASVILVDFFEDTSVVSKCISLTLARGRALLKK